jgi:putative ABC transport system ATP-binding protein
MPSQSEKTPPVIHLTRLAKRFGHGDAVFSALNGIDLTIEKGEFVAIMGPSGCGKTTLLNILGLLDTPSDGEYHLDGTSVAEISQNKRAHIRGRQIGFVFQNFNLLHRMNVIENVALPLTYKGTPRTRRLTAASNMLKTFHLGEREYYMPYQLSGGQLQRVAIARALVNQPSIILADEPTGNLDSKSSEIIMSELSDIHKRGNTIIMVTHNPDLTVHASRVIQMIDGTIASDSKHPPEELDPTAKRPLGKRKRTTKKTKKQAKGSAK